ncbi:MULTISPECIES: efflux RND transporter permease subunit [unclassified Rhizobium]|uniref:efflux RND transporter permease subunit n=1 Tax=unclassified Rhizobium TaxID=2613769 RepID=UPI001ADCCC63|nr:MULTISPECIES: efflux RND transporter permease subunit [unclassified Rhizobium]MBO9102070.1 multidrug efflux RND transporter permease subunit [Rhizobium sp. L58/93]MBO9172134.1 multidrug efflux RND transporter permease subunit [Rhizobium sp. L245/93]QXZ88143.1 multidrug efflux RND transporter permease subunit [Rhizobium sp. K1/93]QXZ94317.1 multidrug efflux RND transporter permease subunit [Rhizobium sp. K15/93]QYA05791.1 multidrug efflux RND transporter permease subunit [Rhizobium sp. B21/9
MLAAFFIDRPVFAWVLSIGIILAGAISLTLLPISQYPNVAPPQITISATYPGASPEDTYEGVTRLVEEELNGIPGLLYYESTSNAQGGISITVTFAPGTAPETAAVEVQNRVRRVEARLPSSIVQQGISVDTAGGGILLLVALQSKRGTMDGIALGDYMSRNVANELRRVPGVGKVQLFGSERAMRVWLDPDKLLGLSLTPADVTNAIQAQNAQVAAGRLGAAPSQTDRRVTGSLLIKGQLTSPDEFGQIVLRADTDGSAVRLRDVARIEVGADSYATSVRIDGKAAAGASIELAPGGNALTTATAIKARLAQLASSLPEDIEYSVPYDTTPFVYISIEQVLMTLAEAMVLVFLVMFLFLQNIRYTIIPTIVVPVALLGACGVMYTLGFSINVLTMFGMVLAIGILVDDAIVVVENVERIMMEEGLHPREATKKAMTQITGAVIGITLVLTAVFVPMAFFPGAVGVIYKQFSLTMVSSILFSAFLALTLTPALCATFLKPVQKGEAHIKKGFFGWFNRAFDRGSNKYSGWVAGLLRRSGSTMLIYLAVAAATAWMFLQLPSSFLPDEDQGTLLAQIQGPADATAERTLGSIKLMEKVVTSEPSVDRVVAISGFSFSGSGENAGLSFITLRDWSERTAEQSAQALSAKFNSGFRAIMDSTAYAMSPPAISGLGTSNGFAFRLQDRGNQGTEALNAARDQFMAEAAKSQILAGVMVEGLADAPQTVLTIDREKANTYGVTFADINQTISTSLGSSYVNDFPNAGRMQRVTVQADANKRSTIFDVMKLTVRNSNGGMVPISAFASYAFTRGTTQIVGYNGFPAVRLSGQAAAGFSSGEAITEVERIANTLPPGFGYEWSGQSLQEIQSGSQVPMLLGLSVILVFLCLAALYESWAIPLSVLLVIPLGVIGAVGAVMLRDMPNDIYFKVGLITIMGLSAKNAILIIEFAKDLRAKGKSTFDAAIEAAHLRFRPILMTSLAFALGVVPLAIATGAGSGSQAAIGTGVLGGMISATVLAIFFVPVFFAFVMKFSKDPSKHQSDEAPQIADK